MGVGPTGDILDIINSWPPEEQQRAHQAIQEIEEQALRDMQVGHQAVWRTCLQDLVCCRERALRHEMLASRWLRAGIFTEA